MINIKNLKNLELGNDIYILANGPSVKNENLSLLKDKITIGMNANVLLEQEFDFVSKYYVVSDKRFLEHIQKREMATRLLNPKTLRIFRKELKSIDDNIYSDRTYYINAIGKNGFSTNLTKGFYFGSTSTLLAIQLAYYLGAKNIYLLGVDLTYSGSSPRFYKEENVQEFDSFTSVQIENIRSAYLELKDLGVNLYNCSPKSLIFPYLPFFNFNDTFKEDN